MKYKMILSGIFACSGISTSENFPKNPETVKIISPKKYTGSQRMYKILSGIIKLNPI